MPAASRSVSKSAASVSRVSVAAAPVLTVDLQLVPRRSGARQAVVEASLPADQPATNPPAPAPAPSAPAGPEAGNLQLAKASSNEARKICLTSPATSTDLSPAAAPRTMHLKFEPSLTRPARDIAPQAPRPEEERRIRLSSLLAQVLEK